MFKDERISKEVMEQYEIIRKSGVSNMFDIFAVKRYARQVGLNALANLSRDDYIYILENFPMLMKGYDIEQISIQRIEKQD